MGGQGGDHGPGASQQYHVWALAAYPPYERTERQDLHRSAAGRSNLGLRRHNGIADEQLARFQECGSESKVAALHLR
jgi:hypothetical protein